MGGVDGGGRGGEPACISMIKGHLHVRTLQLAYT